MSYKHYYSNLITDLSKIFLCMIICVTTFSCSDIKKTSSVLTKEMIEENAETFLKGSILNDSSGYIRKQLTLTDTISNEKYFLKKSLIDSISNPVINFTNTNTNKSIDLKTIFLNDISNAMDSARYYGTKNSAEYLIFIVFKAKNKFGVLVNGYSTIKYNVKSNFYTEYNSSDNEIEYFFETNNINIK